MGPEEVEFYKKNGGQRAYDAEDFIYKFRSSRGNSKYYICIKNPECSVTMCLREGIVFLRKGTHNHGPLSDLIAVECLEARKLEEALVNVHTATPRNLVTSITAELDTPGKASLTSSSKALEMRLQRGRDKVQKHPKTPKTFDEMEDLHPEDLKLTKTGLTFLRQEGLIPNSRTEAGWLYVSNSGLEQLLRCETWIFDGTFSAAPPPFKQIFCINVISHTGRSIPLVWSLLSCKTKKVYRDAVFRPLYDLLVAQNDGEQLEPKVFIGDFEQSILIAAKEVFEDCSLYGCLFHFRKCIRDKIKKLGLIRLENTNTDFQLFVKMIAMLAYLPPEKLQEYWSNGIKNFVKSRLSGKLRAGPWLEFKLPIIQFLTYLRTTWIGKVSADLVPLYAPEMWSVWRSVLDPEIPSTTAGSEGYNNQVNKAVGSGSTWRVVEAIGREESLSNKKMADLAAGKVLVAEATHKRRGAARLKMLKEIKNIVDNGEGSQLEILQALAAASDRNQ